MGNIQLVRAMQLVITTSNDPFTASMTGHQNRPGSFNVGYVQKWHVVEPQLEWAPEPAYELGRDGPIPMENARGAYKGGTIDFERLILWHEELQDAVGYPVDKLSDIMTPFNCEEHLFRPDGTYKLNVFTGCLFGAEELTGEGSKVAYDAASRAIRVVQKCTVYYEYKKRYYRI